MENLIETIVEIVRGQHPDVQAVYLFGSTGTDFETVDSDVDIAILTPVKLASVKCWQLGETVADKLGRNVDLLDMRGLNTVMRFQVVTTGKRIWDNQSMEVELFESTAISMYLRFNEERKYILEDVKATGKIYRGWCNSE